MFLRILLSCKDNPYTINSGYGIAGYYLLQGLKQHHAMGCYAPVGTKYKIHFYEQGIPVYPGVREDFGEDLVEKHYKHFDANLLLQMADVWALNRIPQLARDGKRTGEFIWIIQPPVDFMDPISYQVLERLESAYRVVPWVVDATVRLRKHGLTNVADPIPIGLNTDLWQPVDRATLPNTMATLGFNEDTFNILIAAANQFLRKAWAETFEGIKMFQDNNPDVKVRVFAHAFEAMGDGWDLAALAQTYGLDPKGPETYQMIIGGYDEEAMVRMFNCADVVVNCGLEGFGLATLEAQACGKPIIGLNYGPTPELVKAGLLVPLRHHVITPPNIRRGLPDPADIARALQYVYNAPQSRWKQGPEWVRKNFSWNTIIRDKWLPFLEEIETSLERDCLRGPPPIAEQLRAAGEKVITFD